MKKAFISLGSNLGDRIHYIREAVKLIGMLPKILITKKSSLYESPALPRRFGLEDPHFINAVIEIESQFLPLELLRNLQLIENKLGRVRHEKWAPRTIDLDILAIESTVLEDSHLTLPHPEMTTRDFVLKPLAEIAPEWKHPILKISAVQIRERLAVSSESTRVPPCFFGSL